MTKFYYDIIIFLVLEHANNFANMFKNFLNCTKN